MYNVLGFDPGASTGWCYFKDRELQQFGVLHHNEELYPFLEGDIFKACGIIVVENYRVRPLNKKMGSTPLWSTIGPAKVIGAIEYAAWKENAEVFLQEPSVKPIAAGLAGIKKAPTKGKHHIDALIHCVYWLHQKGVWLVPDK